MILTEQIQFTFYIFFYYLDFCLEHALFWHAFFSSSLMLLLLLFLLFFISYKWTTAIAYQQRIIFPLIQGVHRCCVGPTNNADNNFVVSYLTIHGQWAEPTTVYIHTRACMSFNQNASIKILLNQTNNGRFWRLTTYINNNGKR